MFKDMAKGQEGVDYQVMPASFDDPNMPSEKLFAKSIKHEINALRMTDPEKAKEFDEYIFKRNEIDEVIKAPVDVSEYKEYPGSEKGRYPEDDPDHYSRWFVENQPKAIYGDKPRDYSDIGAKKKYMQMVRDMSENTEYKTPIHYF